MHPYLSHRNYLPNPKPKWTAWHDIMSESRGSSRQWLRSVMRKWQRRKMIAALEAMDDRLLRDIGIYRGDIRRVVDGFDDRELGMVPLAPGKPAIGNEHEVFQKAA